MAPPSKCMLIALLVAFAVVAPSAAARDGGAAKDAAAAPAPSASDEAVHPMGLIDDIIGGITHLPDLPLPQILPCPPDFPKIPLIPCYNVTPSPDITECRPSLAKLTPSCGGFLTNSSSVMCSSPPSRKCCDGAIRQLLKSTLSEFCFCHVLNGDAEELFPAPVNHERALNLLKQCSYSIGPDDITDICEKAKAAGSILPMDAAPSSPPPGPGRQGTKA